MNLNAPINFYADGNGAWTATSQNGYTVTIQSLITANRTYSFPDSAGMLISSLQTMVKVADYDVANSGQINMNTTSDQIITLTGGKKFIITDIVMKNPSVSMTNTTTAKWYTGPNQTGSLIASCAAVSNLVNATTYINAITSGIVLSANIVTGNTLYFSLQNAQGAAATCDMHVYAYIIG